MIVLGVPLLLLGCPLFLLSFPRVRWWVPWAFIPFSLSRLQENGVNQHIKKTPC